MSPGRLYRIKPIEIPTKQIMKGHLWYTLINKWIERLRTTFKQSKRKLDQGSGSGRCEKLLVSDRSPIFRTRDLLFTFMNNKRCRSLCLTKFFLARSVSAALSLVRRSPAREHAFEHVTKRGGADACKFLDFGCSESIKGVPQGKTTSKVATY
jgi:hypothetical protein